MQALAYAYSEPTLTASYKVHNADFQVREVLNFDPDGEGEHLFLLVEKDGLTTQNVQKRLMQYFRLPGRDVSFSGMKDKQAITQQWFSVKLGNKEAGDVGQLNSEHIQIKHIQRNKRKLQRGSHGSNQFFIRLRNLSDSAESLIQCLQKVSLEGVPNYFGEQRFGANGDNVDKALQLFSGKLKVKDRYQRSIYLSAARAYLFNKVLSQRVEDKTWNSYIAGDLMCLAGSSASFKPAAWDQILNDRLAKKDIHPSGPLWGGRELLSEGLCALLEKEVLSSEHEMRQGLEDAGLKQARRALRSMPENLSYKIEDENTVVLEFSLAKGAYATSFLRELVKLRPSEFS